MGPRILLPKFRYPASRVAEARPTYRAIFAARFYGGFRAQLLQRMEGRVRLALDEWRVRGGASDADATLASAYVAGGLVGAIEAWVASDETDAFTQSRAILDLMPAWWPRPQARRAALTDSSANAPR